MTQPIITRGLKRYLSSTIMTITALNMSLYSSILKAEPIAVNETLTEVSFEVEGLTGIGSSDQLAVEVDGYDVTALMSRAGNRIAINVETPLAVGEHKVNVLVFYANGDISTLMEETLTIQQTATVESDSIVAVESTGAESESTPSDGATASANHQHTTNALLSNAYRVDEKNEINYEGVPSYTVNGGLSYRGQGAKNKWQWQAELDTIYDKVGDNNLTGNEWELPNYRLALAHGEGLGKTGVSLGTHTVNREDLMFSSYQRRGVGSSFGDAENSFFQVDVFGLQSEPVTNYNRRLGFPSRVEERTTGGIFTLTPLSNDPQLLKFSGSYLKGETTGGGIGQVSPDMLTLSDSEDPDVIFDETLYGGQSWNIATDSWLGNNSLWLHADYAESNFDSDGLNIGNDYQRDYSKDFQIQAVSGSWFAAGPFDQWVLMLQRREVGMNFFSLGNLSLPGDILLDRASWQASVGSWKFEAETAKEENNLDNEDYLPDQENHRQLFNVYYYPAVDNTKAPWNIVGVPTLNAGVTKTKRQQDNKDALIVGYDMDDTTKETLFGATFYHNYWNWSVQHTIQATEDKSVAIEDMGYILYEPASDQRNRITALQLGFTPISRLSITANWQWSKNQETDFDNVYSSNSEGLDIGWQIVPKKWQISGSYYRGRDKSEFGDAYFFGDSVLQETASLQLTWNQQQAKGRSPGIDWYVKTSHLQQESKLYSELALEDWQILFGFDLSWQVNSH